MKEVAGVGDMMPDIELRLTDGKNIKVSDYRGRKLVVFFYPKDNTPGCTMEAKDFTELKSAFDEAGVALLGISKDSIKKHQNFIEKHNLETPLATDSEDQGLSDALGIWAEKKMYGKSYMGMVRTTYLIGQTGKIEQIWSKVKVKGHANEVLMAAQAL